MGLFKNKLHIPKQLGDIVFGAKPGLTMIQTGLTVATVILYGHNMKTQTIKKTFVIAVVSMSNLP
jgi:hypothetical protein